MLIFRKLRVFRKDLRKSRKAFRGHNKKRI